MVATAARAPSAHDPDLWHVAVAPGETKVLSLEQLDDLFRLDIIDASTRVWQPGMKDWLPLSVVAGLDDEPAPARPAPPPPSARSAPARPAPPPPRPPAPAATVAVPLSAQPIWALPAAAPAPMPAPAPVSRTVPIAAAPVFAAPESIRPMVLNDLPRPAPKQGGGFGRFIIGLAVVASVGVTLYRNDVLREAARSAGQEPTYLRVEAALGSPGFGTPRAVEQLMASSLALPEPGAVSVSTSTALPARSAPEPVAATTSSPTPAAAPAPTSAKEEPAGAKPASLESLVAAQVGARKRAPEPEAPARGRPRSSAPAAPEKSIGIKGSSNKFDPLNGKL